MLTSIEVWIEAVQYTNDATQYLIQFSYIFYKIFWFFIQFIVYSFSDEIEVNIQHESFSEKQRRRRQRWRMENKHKIFY